MDRLRVVFRLSAFELRSSLRNRWFVVFAGALSAMVAGVIWATTADARALGEAGFGRVVASLMGLLILVVPLVGIVLGSISVAGDRERGTLAYILSQPVTLAEVLASKFCGLGLSLASAVLVAFGIGGLVAAARGASVAPPAYIALAGLAVVLALIGASIGLVISAGMRKVGVAVSTGLVAWLGLVFLGDLGLMGSAMVFQVDIGQLLVISMLNPLQVFKMAALLVARGDLEALGPAGIYAVRTYGAALLPSMYAILAIWALLPAGIAYLVARRTGAV